MSRKEQIWVIDDDHAIRWVLEKALQRDGMTVTTFASAGLTARAPTLARRAIRRSSR